MKSKIFTLILSLFFILLSVGVNAQCDPMTSEECPDPENNGEICPDTLDPAFINQFYSQVATIVPPAVYITEDSIEIELHHVKLMEVGNLPEGITWVSNSEDSVFNAGEYYCVLLEGTPDSAGEYALEIVVDVYILFFGVPVNVATVVDSTSLSMLVVDNTGIISNNNASFHVSQNFPNPFHAATRINYYTEKPGMVNLEVYSLMGERVYMEEVMAGKGENYFVFDGRKLSAGTYFYKLSIQDHHAAGIMIRAD